MCAREPGPHQSNKECMVPGWVKAQRFRPQLPDSLAQVASFQADRLSHSKDLIFTHEIPALGRCVLELKLRSSTDDPFKIVSGEAPR